MDITELILNDHHEQRRMFALLDEIGDDPARLGPVWDRLAILLEVHADAEEQLFYPRLLHAGTGAAGMDSAAAETRDAIHDHNQIRDAIHRAAQHPVGSREWWQGVLGAREANSDHMGEEEREALADFRRHASLQVRHDLAVEFAAFEAAHASGVAAEDKNPARYVEDNTR
ncbi:MAG: hemerythrin domain-containing protein [Streptosporangiaceae bacterium]